MFVGIDFIKRSGKGLWSLWSKVRVADGSSEFGYVNKSLAKILAQRFLLSHIRHTNGGVVPIRLIYIVLHPCRDSRYRSAESPNLP